MDGEGWEGGRNSQEREEGQQGLRENAPTTGRRTESERVNGEEDSEGLRACVSAHPRVGVCAREGACARPRARGSKASGRDGKGGGGVDLEAAGGGLGEAGGALGAGVAREALDRLQVQLPRPRRLLRVLPARHRRGAFVLQKLHVIKCKCLAMHHTMCCTR